MKRNLFTIFLLLCSVVGFFIFVAGCPVKEEPTEATNQLAPPSKPVEEVPVKEEPTVKEEEKPTEDATKPEDPAKTEDKTEPTNTTAKTKVRFETQLGNIDILVHPEWDEVGSQHFIELVKDGFYTNAPWFRIVNGSDTQLGVIQCGISGKPELQAKWGMNTIPDSPVVQGNTPWTMVFGKSGQPNSRSTHIFINTKDNSQGLDSQGFSAFAEVIAGKDVVSKIVAKSKAAKDEDFSVSQEQMQTQGVEFIKTDPAFKNRIVWIKKATIIK